MPGGICLHHGRPDAGSHRPGSAPVGGVAWQPPVPYGGDTVVLGGICLRHRRPDAGSHRPGPVPVSEAWLSNHQPLAGMVFGLLSPVRRRRPIVAVEAEGSILLGHSVAPRGGRPTAVVGLLWPVPVGFDGNGSFLFMHGYSCVCSLVQNLTSLAKSSVQAPYKLHASFVFKLVSKLLKNKTCA